MLISNIFSREIFFRMFWVFLIFEILLIVGLVICYHVELNFTRQKIKKLAVENNSEILNSFNNVMETKLSKFRTDLIFIAKQMAMMMETETGNYFNFLKQTNDNNYFPDSFSSTTDCEIVENENPSPEFIKNPILAFIEKNKLFGSKEIKTNEQIIKEIFNSQSQEISDFFKKISVFFENDQAKGIWNENENEKENEKKTKLRKYACIAKSIFKVITIKSIITERKDLLLNSIYLLIDDFIFQYPQNKINKETLQTLPEYSDKITYCGVTFHNKCFSENFNKFLEKYNSDSPIKYFHNLNENLFTFSCIKIPFSLIDDEEDGDNHKDNANFICLENNLTQVLTLNQNKEAIDITSIDVDINSDKVGEDDFKINFSINRDLATFSKIFNDENYDIFQFTDTPYLHQLLYYDIFYYKPDLITTDFIDRLKLEYEEFKELIIKALKTFKEEKPPGESSFSHSQTYIHANFNSSGVIDYGKEIFILLS